MRIKGCDTSHWNSDKQFREMVVTDDASFVFLKATEGRTYTDPTFKKRAKQVIDLGIGVGFYHFARPENNDAEAEALNFINAVKEFGDVAVYVLDWEGTAERFSPSWIRKWCSIIERETGRTPMLYLNYSYAKNLTVDLSDYPLWVAKWGPEPEGAIGQWSMGYTVWQYTNNPYDQNYFDGSIKDFSEIGQSAVLPGGEQEHYCGCCCCKENK